MTYDDEDRMTRITSAGGLNDTFIYNGLGLRVGKTDSTATYSYLCDGTSPGSSVLSDGAAVYTPGQSEHRAGASSYPDFDSLGNILTIDAASGNVTQEGYLLTGFGTPLYTTGSSPTPFQYSGANGCQTDNALVQVAHKPRPIRPVLTCTFATALPPALPSSVMDIVVPFVKTVKGLFLRRIVSFCQSVLSRFVVVVLLGLSQSVARLSFAIGCNRSGSAWTAAGVR